MAAEVAATTQARLVRCRGCALVYSDPPQRVEFIQDAYDRLYSQDASASRVADRRLPVFTDFFERVPATAGARVLDVGCGTGDFLLLARDRGWCPTGVELSPRAAEVARERGLDARTEWSGLSSAGFEAVTLWNVVEFVERPLDMLRDVMRVLIPGGHVFIRTPNERFQLAAYRWQQRLAWCGPLAQVLGEAYYFHPLLWRAATLTAALTRGGFRDIRLWNSRPSAGDPYRIRSRPREIALHTTKRLVHACALGAGVATRGRLLLGSSLSALARKPA